MSDAALLERRLASFRAERAGSREFVGGPATASVHGRTPDSDHALRLAAALDGEVVTASAGTYVRIEPRSVDIPLDRGRLAALPGQAPPDVPLVCLDTETTGLATGAGTVAFLVGLGWWDGTSFRQVQLLLPDHPDEPAFLDALGALIPERGWLVTYNGRGFDWPLLVARFRMSRRSPPVHAGHVDLLPFVRAVFRHRLTDARLRTVEEELLGVRRIRDVDGWEIPGRYLDFLRGGPAGPIAEIVRHNREDVRSLARLLAHAEIRLGDRSGRHSAPAGDLAGLAGAYRRAARPLDALDCLDIALEKPGNVAQVAGGGRWRDDLLVERARLLRRLGRHDDALDVWRDLASGNGARVGVAWIEVAKLLEHRLGDPAAAYEACGSAARIAERSRLLGRPLRALEADLDRRRIRLLRRLSRADAGSRSNVSRAGHAGSRSNVSRLERSGRHVPPLPRPIALLPERGPSGDRNQRSPHPAP